MQQRKGTAAQWISTNSGNGPVLNAGEIGFEIDTNKFKIGDGINHWVDLNYFIDGEGALAEVTALIDGAPAALNTLNELAAAINDDPAFFTTIATNLSNHQADTTDIHGIADTSLLVTTTGTQTLSNKTLTTPTINGGEITATGGTVRIHGIYLPDAHVVTFEGATNNEFETVLSVVDPTADRTVSLPDASGTLALTSYADQAETDAITTAAADATSKVAAEAALRVSGDAASVSTAAADATSKANAAQAAAISAAAADATSKATAARDAAVASAASYTDSSVANLIDSAPGALNTLNELAAAINDDSSFAATVTTALGTKADTSYVDAEITDVLNTVGGNLSTHSSDTTNVHGIADTSLLATQSFVNTARQTAETAADAALTAHSSDTTNIHGIADTSLLATKNYVDTGVSSAISAAVAPLATTSYVDGEISTVTSAISTAVAPLATTVYVDTEISDAVAPLATTVYVDELVGNVTADQSLLGGVGLDWNPDTEKLDIDSTVATKTYVDDKDTIVRDDAITAAANLLTSATKTNITITGNKNGLTITAENGVGDSTTDNLSEGSNNKYFTDERAQDAVGNAVGTGLSYNDATGAVSVDTTVIQARVTNITDTEIGYLDGLSSNIQTQIDTKAPTTNPTFSGTVAGITKSMVGLANVDNTSDANKPVSTAQASAIATAKSEAIADATSQVNAVIAGAPAALNTLDELAAALGDDANFAATLTTNLAAKAPKDSPTFTGTVSGITKSMVGLGNVDNTSDSSKPISSATQTALDAKLASATAASTYAPIASPTFTGTVAGITKAMVGLGNVDNTTDANKPISTATQTALDLKANTADIAELSQDAVNTAIVAGTGLDKVYNDASNTITLDIDSTVATLTGTQTLTNKTLTSPSITTPTGITKSDVGLGNVDNTTDANKPVSSATQTALDLKAPLASPTFTGTVTLPSGTVTSGMILDGTIVAGDLADGAVTSAKILDGTIVNADINASAAIALSKLATDPLARANHTGTQTASTISNFDTQVRTSRLDQMAAPTASVALNSQKITGLAAPTDANDAATKQYVDSAVEGLHVHPSVKAATTANITLATAVENGDVLDGVTLATGDRILVKNQTTKSQNGIYVVAASGAPTRALDFDTAAEVDSGDFVFVDQGTVNANTGYVQINTPAIIGTDDIEFVQFSGAGTYTAGTGLTLTGTVFSINTGTTVDLSTSQTLSNKTFVAPVLGSATATSINGTSIPSNKTLLTTDSGSVTSAMIADGAIVDADVNASAAIAQSKISGLTSDLAAKAPLASPTFTGTVAGITKSMVGLGNVDNTTDAAKPISTATQTALDLKANLASPTLTGTPLSTTAAADTNTTQIATTAYVVGQASSSAPVMDGTAAVGTSLKYARADHVHATDTSRAPIANPTFTGTVAGITKSMVGLANVDNTADSAKPVSTAQQTALDLKANLAGPTFTGTVTLPNGTVTSAMILDGTIVDGDISATAAIAQSKIDGLSTSLGLKANLASPALTGTPTAPTAAAGTNTTQVATTAFVGTAVADLVASAPSALNTLNELATALGNDASFSTTVTNAIAAKSNTASPTFTGTVTIPTLTLTNPLTAANGGTGLSSLGTGVATFLGTPSSANLAAMLTDEIGTGNVVLSEIATNAQTASYTLVLADRGKMVEMNVGSANNLTVPLDSSVNFPVGTQIDILQVGSGQTTVVATGGVTVNGTPGLKIRAQWGGATLIKRAANTWVLIGDLTV